ncbi:hypothetical protein LINGRAHAP2_LOCUS17682, partial [Linum grandiflorum]
VDCPRLRRENERALQAVWGGSEDDDDSSDGEVIAAQAHMAIAETVKNTTEVCYLAANQENEWILDSGCTHHMTDISLQDTDDDVFGIPPQSTEETINNQDPVTTSKINDPLPVE